jgi:hypothetical protein
MKLALAVVGLVGLSLWLYSPVFWWDGPVGPTAGPLGTIVGLIGGVFGLVVGLAGGAFGAAVGLLAGLFGAAVGLVAGLFGAFVGLAVVTAVFGLPLLVVALVIYGLTRAVAA